MLATVVVPKGRPWVLMGVVMPKRLQYRPVKNPARVGLQTGATALLPGPDAVTEAEYLDIATQRIRDYRSHPLIDVWFAPPGPQWVSDELMEQLAERAAEDLPVAVS